MVPPQPPPSAQGTGDSHLASRPAKPASGLVASGIDHGFGRGKATL